MEKNDTFLLIMVTVGVVTGLTLFYVFWFPDSEATVAREAEAAQRLGLIWGEVETADTLCPDIEVDSAAIQELLKEVNRTGENMLATIARMAAKPEWYSAYSKGAQSVRSLGTSGSNEAMCSAMMAAYGASGSRTPGLLKASANSQ